MKVRDIIGESAPADLYQSLDYWRYRLNEADEKWRTPAMDREIGQALDELCGRHIGGGAFREVWEHRTDPDLVVKIDGLGECRMDGGTNRAEYLVWSAVKGTKLEKWFAPVTWHSAEFWVILQQKAAQPPDRRLADPALFPARMPRLFSRAFDVKHLSNWGGAGGRPVIFDYSFVRPQDLTKANMVPVPVQAEMGWLSFQPRAAGGDA